VSREEPHRLRHGGGEAERVQHEVDVARRAAQGAHEEPPERDPGRRDELGLEAAPAADPAQLRRIRARA
jgi:hypothetical protein